MVQGLISTTRGRVANLQGAGGSEVVVVVVVVVVGPFGLPEQAIERVSAQSARATKIALRIARLQKTRARVRGTWQSETIASHIGLNRCQLAQTRSDFEGRHTSCLAGLPKPAPLCQ